MTWHSSLPTLTDGGTPTAAQINQYLDNINYLRNPSTWSYQYTGTADISISGTASYGTISGFEGTLITQGGYVEITFMAAARRCELDLQVDGTRFTSTSVAGTGAVTTNIAGYYATVNLPILITDLTAGTHTFRMLGKALSVTAGDILAAYQPRFYVREL